MNTYIVILRFADGIMRYEVRAYDNDHAYKSASALAKARIKSHPELADDLKVRIMSGTDQPFYCEAIQRVR